MINAELHSICERIARLERERKELARDIADIKLEAKSKGYDASLITKTVRLMNMDEDKRKKALEQHDLFDTYLNAAGLLTHPAVDAERHTFERVPAAEPSDEPGAAGTGEGAAAADPVPAHDPETGEITEGSGNPAPSGARAPCPAEPDESHSAAAPDELDEFGRALVEHFPGTTVAKQGGEFVATIPLDEDIPAFLDRRKRTGASA